VLANDLIAEGGVFAFVGPTGAGKTTTIAKLAARYVLEHGNADVALVTTDSYRIGAHEQLRTLSRILNIPCKIVGAQLDLGTALYDLRQCRLVLIDTAGFNMRAPELQQQLAALSALGDRVRCLQVLAVNSQQQVLKAAQRAYRPDNLVGCIFTKLDEAASLGEALSLLIETGLPLAYVADGQAIPGDIVGAQAKALVAKTIELAKQIDCDEERLAQAFTMPRPNTLSA
jgi:flagellar biosynthesis protein FlhF